MLQHQLTFFALANWGQRKTSSEANITNINENRVRLEDKIRYCLIHPSVGKFTKTQHDKLLKDY